MKFVADESVDGRLVAFLRQQAHEVLYVAEMSPGISDEQVLELSNSNDVPLITEDKDFGELVFRQKLAHTGIVLIRLAGTPVNLKCQLLLEALKGHANELRATFSVLDARTFRIRSKIQ